ncbi:MAG: hypothetical protein Phog2KO_26690 [Phototrophicaceae bacterium]
MAGAFEQTIVVGNVGRDAELRYTQSGTAVSDFSVAVTSKWRDNSTNEQREKTSWYRVTAWRGLAEVVGKYVKKGMSVMVVGTVEANAYMGQDGEPRASLDITARDIQFLNRAGDNAGGNYDNDNNYSNNSNNNPQDLDDIPF